MPREWKGDLRQTRKARKKRKKKARNKKRKKGAKPGTMHATISTHAHRNTERGK
jgi:ribosome assembly protein YihI (activator of Der GTPase)